ncbi:MAG: hypothetical protein MZV70_50085 [Desulfobacterales bacterium]|nr:hypothetical protein [Desulfobacterales bacterium]
MRRWTPVVERGARKPMKEAGWPVSRSTSCSKRPAGANFPRAALRPYRRTDRGHRVGGPGYSR